MAIRNPAATESAVIPKHVTTRILFRAKGACRRAVYSKGRHIGYTFSSLGAHRAEAKDKSIILDGSNEWFTYLSNAVVAVAEAADGCKGWNEECGNPTGGNDLCPDCTMARLDAQSPRIPA